MALPRAWRRRSGRTALYCVPALVAALVALAGCGGLKPTADTRGLQLTVYSSLPLQGPSRPVSLAIVNGEKLALSQAGGHIGPFQISYFSLDDSNPATGQWDPGMTAADARIAAQDNSTIAYLGDYNSGASAISLPLINAADILQISPASPYVGLTSSLDAGQDEPSRFYPTGLRTFGRIMPPDLVQGAALALLMHRVGVAHLYILSDTDPFESSLAAIVQQDALRRGIAIAGSSTVDPTAGDFRSVAAKIAASGADAVFYGGGANASTALLWRQVYAADPSLRLFGSNAAADPTLTAALGRAAHNLYLTTPLLAGRLYPPAAQRFFRVYRQTFGLAPEPWVLYGYEAMQLALTAIRHAGANGNSRGAVVQQFFRIRDRNSVLGRYSIAADGDTTLSDYGVDRVVRGRLVFDTVLHVAGPAG